MSKSEKTETGEKYEKTELTKAEERADKSGGSEAEKSLKGERPTLPMKEALKVAPNPQSKEEADRMAESYNWKQHGLEPVQAAAKLEATEEVTLKKGGGKVTINKSDFDPQQHVRSKAKAEDQGKAPEHKQEEIEADVAGGSEETDADTSPVSDSNATDAVEQVGRMRSTEKLQQIVDSDKRSSVKDAAQKRLDELNQ